MAILEWKKEGAVAVITMTNGENRHNPDFAALLLGALDEIEKDTDVSSVVIASSDEKNWSQGIDTNWLMSAYGKKDFQAIRDFLYGMNKIFKRIILYPMPVIAAINGHAFGNGAILACACDFRFMRSDKGFFCFPEVDINIPFLPGMVCDHQEGLPRIQADRGGLYRQAHGWAGAGSGQGRSEGLPGPGRADGNGDRLRGHLQERQTDLRRTEKALPAGNNQRDRQRGRGLYRTVKYNNEIRRQASSRGVLQYAPTGKVLSIKTDPSRFVNSAKNLFITRTRVADYEYLIPITRRIPVCY